MARKRDVIIGIIIAVSFLVTIFFFVVVFMGAFTADNEVSIGGFGSKVAVIDVFGTINESESVVRQLKKWGKASGVKAIVLHVDSPGGGVAPSQEIYDEILRVRNEDEKTVIVSMSSLAASGGYYISCAAEKIMADPGTLTGSIGVIIEFINAQQLLEKVGVGFERVKSGEMKDVGSPDRKLTDREREMLSAVVMDTYEQFVEVVSEGRNLDKQKVYSIANGSIFTGRQAKDLGLVDTLGTYEDAIRYAAQLAGIEGEPRVVRETKPKTGLFDLFGSALSNVKDIAKGDVGGPRVKYLY